MSMHIKKFKLDSKTPQSAKVYEAFQTEFRTQCLGLGLPFICGEDIPKELPPLPEELPLPTAPSVDDPFYRREVSRYQKAMSTHIAISNFNANLKKERIRIQSECAKACGVIIELLEPQCCAWKLVEELQANGRGDSVSTLNRCLAVLKANYAADGAATIQDLKDELKTFNDRAGIRNLKINLSVVLAKLCSLGDIPSPPELVRLVNEAVSNPNLGHLKDTILFPSEAQSEKRVLREDQHASLDDLAHERWFLFLSRCEEVVGQRKELESAHITTTSIVSNKVRAHTAIVTPTKECYRCHRVDGHVMAKCTASDCGSCGVALKLSGPHTCRTKTSDGRHTNPHSTDGRGPYHRTKDERQGGRDGGRREMRYRGRGGRSGRGDRGTPSKTNVSFASPLSSNSKTSIEDIQQEISALDERKRKRDDDDYYKRRALKARLVALSA
jgi:hypothetical protein